MAMFGTVAVLYRPYREIMAPTEVSSNETKLNSLFSDAHQWWCDTNSSQHCKGPRAKRECNCKPKSSLIDHGRWDEGPCYICGESVPPSEGWHREDHDSKRRHWCKAHRPAWNWGERECIQHGYDYSAICSICGPWWREQASPEERRKLHLLAAPLMAGCESAEREDEE